MATLFSAATLGAPDMFKLPNQTAANWARHIIRLVSITLGRAFSLYILFRCTAPFELARGKYFQSSRAAHPPSSASRETRRNYRDAIVG
jgi:hypothetical protein